MTTSASDPVASDQLRVSAEMGDDDVPSPRLAATLDELTAALQDDDVTGYNNFEEIKVTYRSFSFDSLKLGSAAATSGEQKWPWP